MSAQICISCHTICRLSVRRFTILVHRHIRSRKLYWLPSVGLKTDRTIVSRPGCELTTARTSYNPHDLHETIPPPPPGLHAVILAVKNRRSRHKTKTEHVRDSTMNDSDSCHYVRFLMTSVYRSDIDAPNYFSARLSFSRFCHLHQVIAFFVNECPPGHSPTLGIVRGQPMYAIY